jgi:hypothetical protein
MIIGTVKITPKQSENQKSPTTMLEMAEISRGVVMPEIEAPLAALE